jgi:hypothetical protein
MAVQVRALGSAQERGNGFILVSVMGFPEHFVEDAHAFSSADGNGCHRLSHALSNTVEQRVLSKGDITKDSRQNASIHV